MIKFRMSLDQYDHRPLAKRLLELAKRANATRREVSLGAGLDHGAMSRFITGEGRPGPVACIQLAMYFDINPNELLTLAAYEPMPIFDLSLIDPNEFPPEVKRVAGALTDISDAVARQRICKAIMVLLNEQDQLVR